ncbi:Flagellar biosynthetic protein FliR [Melioribacter roseus P3M-2]|uniref:Flagellar biosynthetic protein FliR n=1 Tax=Melioribacter roseus (strain DSM 23840 / JCM 17771 / VKM B-2668 / P3M-2) TaxID=1191523 RepID=I6Z873_MELRP|nr:flagellar biosynthetic protein FliR [Melioribacter roseus]AFN75375.1 Flagellar biosynthetic protein FliR [Melioribacter roseus P3M-2]
MTTNILIKDFILFIFVFMRIGGLIFAAPVLSFKGFPVLARIFLAIVIAYIVFFTLNKSNVNIDLDLTNQSGLTTLFFYSIRELLTGLILGYAMNFIFWAVSYAGHYIGFDMGLMLAEALNPVQEIQTNIVGQFLYYSALMIFILINGHHYLISGLTASFSVVPIGKYVINEPVYTLLIKYSFLVFTIAIKIASPIIVSFFLVHLAESIIARVIPNMQIIYITQPLKSLLGIFMILSLIPFYVYVLKNLLEGYEYKLLDLIRAMGQ